MKQIYLIATVVCLLLTGCGTSSYNSSWGPSGGPSKSEKGTTYPATPKEVVFNNIHYTLKPEKVNDIQDELGYATNAGHRYPVYSIKGKSKSLEVAIEVNQGIMNGKYWAAYANK